MATTITGGVKPIGAGMALLGMSPLGMLQVAMASGIGPNTTASVDASGAESAVPEGRTEASASADTASAGRPGILKPEGGRPAASDASAAAADDSFGPKVSFASDDDPASFSGLTAGMRRASTASKCTDAATVGSCVRSVCMLEVMLEVPNRSNLPALQFSFSHLAFFFFPGLLRCFQSLGPFVLAPLPGLCLSEKGREPSFTGPGSTASGVQLVLSR